MIRETFFWLDELDGEIKQCISTEYRMGLSQVFWSKNFAEVKAYRKQMMEKSTRLAYQEQCDLHAVGAINMDTDLPYSY